jgi:hypothetical protein
MSKLPSLAPQNMTEAMEFSKMLSVSEMVPKSYQKKPQDILVAVQWGYELGLQPLQALQNIAIINGKPSVYGDAALALVKNDPRCAGVSEKIEGEGDARTAYCKVKRRYGEEIEETVAQFSVADAKRARLWNKQGPWSQYPDRMLQMRARGFAIRDAFPDALKGVITAEEAQDYPSEPKDVTPRANPLDQIQAPPAPAPEPEPSPAPEPMPEPEIEDAIEVQPQAEQEYPAWQLFNHLGKPYGKEAPHTSADYVGALLSLMNKYSNISMSPEGDTLEPREKMTMLRELREKNQVGIDKLGEMKTNEVMEGYKALLRRLGAEMNDE